MKIDFNILKKPSTWLIKAFSTFVFYLLVLNIWPSSIWGPVLLYLSALMFLFSIYLARKSILSFFSKRGTKTASGAIFSVILFLGILLAVNYIVSSHNKIIDFTKNKINTLSQQTESVLKNLENNLDIIAFVKDGPDKDYIASFIKKYQYINQDKINFKAIDPNKEPLKAQEYNITSYGTLVLEYKGKNLQLTELTEEKLTNSIIKITRASIKEIYFLTGHSEMSISDENGQGLSQLSEAIKSQGYKTEGLNLVETGGIPDNSALLVIAEPKKGLMQKEIDIIIKYLNKGGKILVLKGPEISKGIHQSINSINKILKVVSAKLRNDFIVETQNNLASVSMGLSNAMPIGASYSTGNKITKGFKDITFYPIAQSIELGLNTKYQLERLVQTTESSVAIVKPKSGKIDLRTAKHLNGPLSIAVIAEPKTNNTLGKIIIFASSLFATNQYIGHAANADMILNSVSYLVDDSDLISIRPKKADTAQFKMTQDWIPLLSVYIIPFIILVFGIAFWIKRRKS